MEKGKDISAEKLNEIKIKIQKLMALKEQATTPGEAAAAAGRINKLLLVYNLTEMEVNAHKAEVEEEISAERGAFDDYQSPYEGDYAKDLLSTLCHFNLCQLINHRATRAEKQTIKNKGRFTILGKKNNVAITYYMFDFCLVNLKRIFEKHWEAEKLTIKQNKNPYRRAWNRGAVEGIYDKLLAEKRAAEQEHGVEQMNALVKYNDAAIEKRVKELFPDLKKARAQKPLSDEGMGAMLNGYMVGRNMNISKALTGDEDGNTPQFLKDKPKQIGNGN